MPTKRTPVESTKQPSISLLEASKMAGVSPSTLRRWLDGGGLKGAKNPRGDWEITHHDLMSYLAMVASRRAPRRATIGAHRGGSMEPPMESTTVASGDALRMACARIEDLERSLDRERSIADDLRSENKNLTSELVKLSREMQALLSGPGQGAISRWLRSTLKPTP